MGILEAFILGLVQGITEFLPVSSSGHLEIVKAIFGSDAIPKESMAFTVVLHFATALSTLVIFRKEILYILKGLFQFKWNEQTQFSLKIIFSMIPAVIIGLSFEQELERLFSSNLTLVGMMLLITAGLLLLADKAVNTNKKVSFKNALFIGVSQAVAMLPGISRSGATISTSVILGIDRTKAARFSFLMVVPLILGKVAKDLLEGNMSFEASQTAPMFVGFVTAFVSGFVACRWMITLVKKSKLSYFSIYCCLVGIISIVYSLI